MEKSAADKTIDFLIKFIPDALPKPFDSAAKAALDTFRDPRTRSQLVEAARQAESDFRSEARKELKSDKLIQVVVSFPLFDNEHFQSALAGLSEDLDEEHLAQILQDLISNDWKEEFTPAELREGVAIYLKCLRKQLLKVESFAVIISRLAILRIDERTEGMDKKLDRLLENSKLPDATIEKQVAAALFTIHPPVTDFTGREKQLEKLKSEFSRGALITGVSGGGGVGKTELARRLAQELEEQFPDARMEINLQGTLDTSLTTDDAMRRLLEPFYPNQKLPDESAQLQGLYQETFSKNKALLLLDNAANASQVRSLVPPAPSTAIITSRNHFSLSEKGLKEPLRLDVLSYEEARSLLQGAAPKLQERKDVELDALSDLCGRLPLALRVAAALLNDSPGWSLDTLINRLKDERTRLKKLKREDDQDLDVEAAISLSYNQLGDLQKPFRYLGIFPAPFWSSSAAAVWGIEKEEDASDVLSRLVNRSLVNFLPVEGDKPALYTLHDLTRFYTVEHLREDAVEAMEAVERHAKRFLEIATEAENEYERGNEYILIGLNLFRFIWPHLANAYVRLLPEQKDWPRPQAADRWLSEFPGRCANVMDLQLPPKEKIIYLQTALDASKRLRDRQAEGVHLGNLGTVYMNLGDARKAIEFYEQALVIDREMGNRSGEGGVLGNLGLAYANLGDAKKAIEFHEQALLIDREIGDRRGEGMALGNLGSAYTRLGEADKAMELYKKRIEIAHEIGDRRGEGAALGNLGSAYATLGDTLKAIEFYEQALAIAREIGDRRNAEYWLGNLGNVYLARGDTRKAIESYEQILVMHREIGDRRGEGMDLGNLGSAYYKLGDVHKAIEFNEQALAIAHEIGDRDNERIWLNNLGRSYYFRLGNVHKAMEFYAKDLEIAREMGDLPGEGNALAKLGNAYDDLGEKEKSRELFQQALAIYEALKSPSAKKIRSLLEALDDDDEEEEE